MPRAPFGASHTLPNAVMAPLKQAASKAGPAEVKELVAELKNGTQNAKASAARMLGAIAARDPPPAAPVAGAIKPLVDLLSGEHGEGAQEEGAHALFALADNAANRVSITEAGGIGPLVVVEDDDACMPAVMLLYRCSITTHVQGKCVPWCVM